MLQFCERVGRYLFWALPAPLREQLHGVRHETVRMLRRRRALRKGHSDEVNWAAFSEQALRDVEATPIVIFEPNLDWAMPQPQRPHHMARILGQLGCVVIYRTFAHEVVGARKVAQNLWVCSDPGVERIPGAIRCFASTSLSASASDLAAARRQGPVVYDYIDRIDAAISGGQSATKRLLRLRRAAFNGGATLVVSSARELHAEAVAACGTERCVYVPNGVDVEHYRRSAVREHESARKAVAALRKVRARSQDVVGYFGAIAPWLWYEALDELAIRMPEVSFVYLGADYSGCVPRLPRHPNVLYAGAVHYEQLPMLARLFDVCFIPFRLGEIARATSPLKLYEYFALEKPVVVTADLEECLGYRGVFVGSDVTSLERALRQALAAKGQAELCTDLRRQADANSWATRGRAFLQALHAVVPGDIRDSSTSAEEAP